MWHDHGYEKKGGRGGGRSTAEKNDSNQIIINLITPGKKSFKAVWEELHPYQLKEEDFSHNRILSLNHIICTFSMETSMAVLIKKIQFQALKTIKCLPTGCHFFLSFFQLYTITTRTNADTGILKKSNYSYFTNLLKLHKPLSFY